MKMNLALIRRRTQGVIVVGALSQKLRLLQQRPQHLMYLTPCRIATCPLGPEELLAAVVVLTFGQRLPGSISVVPPIPSQTTDA